MAKTKSRVKISVESKTPAMPYDQLPEAARNAMCDALLILAQRGREVLAGQVNAQIKRSRAAREAQGRS
jgi:hypothetical protein